MDDSMPELAPLHHQLHLLVQRWLPIALSRAGAGKDRVDYLRDPEGSGRLVERVVVARELAQALHRRNREASSAELDLSQALVGITDRLARTLALARVDLDAAKTSADSIQRDLIGCVMGVEIRAPRPRAKTPSWAQVPLPAPMMRI